MAAGDQSVDLPAPSCPPSPASSLLPRKVPLLGLQGCRQSVSSGRIAIKAWVRPQRSAPQVSATQVFLAHLLTLFSFLSTFAKFGHELMVNLGLCRGAPLEEREIDEGAMRLEFEEFHEYGLFFP